MSVKLIDLHQDLLLHVNRRDLFSDHWQTNFEMLSGSNTSVVIATAFPVPKNKNFLDPVTNQMIEKDFSDYKQLCDKHQIKIIQNNKDLKEVQEKDTTGLILHIEGLNVFTSTDWEMLEGWHSLGWRSLGIVWNVTNSLGGGTKDKETGLTDLGVDVLIWCEQKGMIVDFAHMNHKTFMDAAKIVSRPILVSHGNAKELCNSPRNYSDEQLDIISKSGGILGVFFAKSFVTKKSEATVSDVVDHIDYLVNRMGIEHVGIGSDFGGILSGFPDGLDSLLGMQKLWDELMDRGYKKNDIEKMAWKNALRVIEQHLVSRQ